MIVQIVLFDFKNEKVKFTESMLEYYCEFSICEGN